jgi:hypothetical protein
LSEKGVRAAPRLSDLQGCLMKSPSTETPVQSSHYSQKLPFSTDLYTAAEMLELIDWVSCCA